MILHLLQMSVEYIEILYTKFSLNCPNDFIELFFMNFACIC